ncbi:MAG: hypothetical protein HY259_01340 [Chloroflexi bacterium]|nr:hypothetical protein [Chloroflexota bacterium]
MAIRWVQPRTRAGRLTAGAISGAVAGEFVFGLLVAAAAGIAAQSSLYGIAFSRVGYGAEWTLKLAIAVSTVFPFMIGANALLIGGGTLMGALSATFTPVRPSTEVESTSHADDVLNELAVSIGYVLLMGLTLVVAVAVLALLSDATQNVFNEFGFEPRWSLPWSLRILFLELWLGIVIFQLLHIRRLRRLRSLSAWLPRGAPLGRVLTLLNADAFIAVAPPLVMLALPILDRSFDQRPDFQGALIISVALGIEGLLALRAVRSEWSQAQARPAAPPPAPTQWTGASLVAGALAGALGYQFVAIALSMVLISVVLIAPLVSVTEPPIGLERLTATFPDLFSLSRTSFIIWILAGMLMGISIDPLKPRAYCVCWPPC